MTGPASAGKHKFDETPLARGVDDLDEKAPFPYSVDESDDLKPRFDSTHRKLKPRHIQLIGIGGQESMCFFMLWVLILS
jgi:amino acid permease